MSLLNKGSSFEIALSRLSARALEDSVETSIPRRDNYSTKSYNSFYFGYGCLRNIAKVG